MELSLYVIFIAIGIIDGIYVLPNHLDRNFNRHSEKRTRFILNTLYFDCALFVILYMLAGWYFIAVIILSKWITVALFDVEVLARGEYLD